MKKRFKIIFICVTLCLIGIAALQAYWSVNAYRVNKKKFDADIDLAMQQALDSCKKDYFDSIRVVLVKRLSDTSIIKIQIDTLHKEEGKTESYSIWLKGPVMSMGTPFTMDKGRLDFYRQKIKHHNSIPELLTETSFYVPHLLEQIKMIVGGNDIAMSMQWLSLKNGEQKLSKKPAHQNLFDLPPDYRQADSLRILTYFQNALVKKNLGEASPQLAITTQAGTWKPADSSESFTNEYSYKYHGFTFLEIVGPELFIRGTFRNPSGIILRQMLLVLVLTCLLVIFTAFCFFYVLRTILQQKRLADLKDDFINNMTHELKTPIATIGVALEGLQKFNALNDPEKTQRYLQTSRNELNHLNQIVNRVLDVAALENEDYRLNLQQVPIDELITEIIQAERFKTGKVVDIDYINSHQIKTIPADPVHLRNVLVNLIDNAIKYSVEPVKVAVNCYQEGNSIKISIRDNGIGIAPAHADKIFEKFYRVPTGNIHDAKGTGLGLSYVKYIVEAHGGSIAVKSRPGAGSEFIITLPV